ncbi:Uma2 family endonuclease [Leptolyngbya sp. PCC 6406]|uniref:Uma2 family endonuclease n=1 Tax=Leptolyngbya sp. PCC 6406 TaxID=1173264 RepID=UPI0002AD1470|nr:Uma2 family endonuclease [Leptolyngbya sp. PCC 6406]
MAPAVDRVRWTTTDLALFPEEGKRYEIIDGVLIVTRAPSWSHQRITGRVFSVLDRWSQASGLGEAAINPGIVFTDEDNVIPDVVWVSRDRLALLMDEAEHLTGAPELVVEVLSPGLRNVERDRQLKLKLYSQEGVQEYWILDPALGQVQVYRRDQVLLRLTSTLYPKDTLTSPLLPGFTCVLEQIFSGSRSQSL